MNIDPRAGHLDPYRAPLDRAAALLALMTLEEKVGQLSQYMGSHAWQRSGDGFILTEAGARFLAPVAPGALYGALRSDPWMGAALTLDVTPRQAAEIVNLLQRYTLTQTRLGIPLMFGEECSHGHMAVGATVFPVPLALGSTWDADLVEQVQHAVAAEARAVGASVTYSPVLDLALDPRWGRTEECFSEDPYLTARLGAAAVRGLQGARLDEPDAVMATLKHFIHATPEGGRNTAPAHLGPRELRELYLPPFAAAIRAGAGSVMASYNEIDGIPSSASHWLLNDVLRGELGFAGFITSDWEAIRWLSEIHRVAPDLEAAAGAALAAGIDLEMQGSRNGGAYAAPLLAAAAAGRIPLALIDAAAERILAAKFALGLFEKPYAAPERATEVVRCPAHRELTREAARRSIVLLKNEGELLPLPATLRRIAVIGPNADDVANQLGDYTGRQDRRAIATVLDGVRAAWPQAEVEYAEGCRVREANADLRSAVEAAQRAEVAILVGGGSSAQGFAGETAAAADVVEAVPETNSDRDCGEHYDRVDLELSGSQSALVDAVAATGTPVVVVLIQGRPSAIPAIAARIPAILCAWYPGEQGGCAVADVLSGRAAPAGRLPVSIPRSAGQLPCFYHHKPSSPSIRGRYVESVFEPLYPFGYGLTYTTFQFADPCVLPDRIGLDGAVQASVAVTNTGARAGEAVAQFYIRDEYASVTRPVKQLAGWARVMLAPGETRRVSVTIDAAQLSFVGEDLRRQTEPGRFCLMVGGDSQTLIDTTFEVVA